MKMSKGYQWEVSCAGSDMAEILAKIQAADAALQKEYEAPKMAAAQKLMERARAASLAERAMDATQNLGKRDTVSARIKPCIVV